MRYRLNFKGFFDTPEELFGAAVTEAITDVDFGDIEELVINCITNIETKLGVKLNRNNIEGIQFFNSDKFAAQLLVTGQNRYMLLVNPNKILNQEALVSTLYHELCHMYQLDKLFAERLMFYDYAILDIIAVHEEDTEVLKSHLNVNGGHTVYWQELASEGGGGEHAEQRAQAGDPRTADEIRRAVAEDRREP